eukprot:TRINITY_DN577_c0_g1_i3.p1 TRINITY_DN577_c0_g1~~TRINITY_DN577_c0_g1_i3.p1  ORF type:complete len:869 (+),score=44.98 TRINITY_DN577_c0_g1_i3:193-2607(+)
MNALNNIGKKVASNLVNLLKRAFSKCKFYFESYPRIDESSDKVSYYRKANEFFRPMLTLLTVAFISSQVLIAILYRLDTKFLQTLPGIAPVWLFDDIAIGLTTYYCHKILSSPQARNKRKDLNWQISVHFWLQVFMIFPAFTFMLTPLMVANIENSAEIAAAFWLSVYAAQLHICIWIADAIVFKVFLMVAFNTVYCVICVYEGYFKTHNLERLVVPIFLSAVLFLGIDYYIKQNFILKRTLKRQKLMYEKHLEKSKDPVVILESPQIAFKNETARENFGESLEGFYEKARHMTTESGENLEAYVKRLLSEDIPHPDRVSQLKFYQQPLQPDTPKRTLNVTMVETCCYSKKKVSLTLQDITEELIKEERRVESKYKNMILFSLSHELRTPLNIFSLFLTIAKEFMRSGEALEAYMNAKGAWRYLRNKINDILDYAQIISNEFVLHKFKFSLKRFVNQLEKHTNYLLGDKRPYIRLEFGISNEISDEIMEDQDRLEQVLFNFLSNATKYTQSGTISLKICPDPTDLHKIVFQVADTGCGMSEEVVKNLFKLKESADTSESSSDRVKSTELSGLGLTISRMICNHMGTDIVVHSALNKGSTFEFAIPVIESPVIDPTVPEEEIKIALTRYADITGGKSARRSLRKKMVALIVDDQEYSRFVTKDIVQKFGCEVMEATDGKMALETLSGLRYTAEDTIILVFMEVELRGMNGIQTAKEIRKMNIQPRPYIVALSTYGLEIERKLCLEAGMDYFVINPLVKDVLGNILRELHVYNQLKLLFCLLVYFIIIYVLLLWTCTVVVHALVLG